MSTNSFFPIVVEYGRKGGDDIDRVVILGQGRSPRLYVPAWPEDVCEMTRSEFVRMSAERHPAVTELILKGIVIQGDLIWFESIRKRIVERPIPVGVVGRLGEWALWNLKTSNVFLARYLVDHNISDLTMSLGNMSYGVSCSLFSSYYRNNIQKVVPLETVLSAFEDQGSHFSKVRAMFKLAQKSLFWGGGGPRH